MKSATPRLIALLCGFLLMGAVSFGIARQTFDIAPGVSGLPLGMRWLQRTYRLDETTFAEIQRLHRSYALECERRCLELNDLNRLFLTELRTRSGDADLSALQGLEGSLCNDCRIAMIHHVYEVAEVMPAEAKSAFLADFQSILLPKKQSSGQALR